MTGVPPLSKSIGWTRGITEGRNMMLDLQRQLATGKKSATYGGLGPDAALALATRARLSSIDAFQTGNQHVDLRIKMMTEVLDRFVSLGRELRSDAIMPSYELTGGDRTGLQIRAENALDEALSLMGSDVAGRYLFSGAAVDTDPVADKSAIMDGQGGKAGFNQVLAERKAADLGADGLGRLELEQAGAEVIIAEDHDGPFGFKITGLHTTIDGAAASGPVGVPQQAAIDFDNADPKPDDTVNVTLALPDGTEIQIKLKVAADGEGAPEKGRFEAGATPDETAQNFRSALEATLGKASSTELAAASAFAAADDFFNYDADGPRRVNADGTDLEADTQNTVLWYRGDNRNTDPRQTAIARVDDQIQVSYGARANEEALRASIQTYAVLAAETFNGADENDKLRYEAMRKRAVTNLSYGDGREAPQALQGHLAAQHHTLGKANERHTAMKGMAQEMLASAEEADPHEVAVKLLQLQTRLEASYHTTAMLSKMSLVYYM